MSKKKKRKKKKRKPYVIPSVAERFPDLSPRDQRYMAKREALDDLIPGCGVYR